MTTFNGAPGLLVRLPAVKLFEPDAPDTAAVPLKKKKLKAVTYSTAAIPLPGRTGPPAASLASLATPNELTGGLVTTNAILSNAKLATLETDFTLIGHHGDNAPRPVEADTNHANELTVAATQTAEASDMYSRTPKHAELKDNGHSGQTTANAHQHVQAVRCVEPDNTNAQTK